MQTALGGPAAPLTVGESIPRVADTMDSHTGEGGLRFLNHLDETIPW